MAYGLPTPAQYREQSERLFAQIRNTPTTPEEETMTDTQYAVFATTPEGDIVRGLSFEEYGAAVEHWTELDNARRAGLYPHVKHFEVRSTPDPKYSAAPNGTIQFIPTDGGRGFADDAYFQGRRTLTRTGREKAARVAWKRTIPAERGIIQGSGGWFYRNGQPVAQGLRSLATVCERHHLIVTTGGRSYVTALAKKEDS